MQRPSHDENNSSVTTVEQGINGLQGLMILIVVAGALPGPWAPVGSFFAIDVLLMLIGFSATRSLWLAHLNNEPIHFSDFYTALIRRLVPLVWILSAIVVLLAFAFATDSWMWLRRDLLNNVLFISDVTEIANNEPVTENYQRAPLLWHLWLFSLIAQLGLLLPFVMSIAKRFKSAVALRVVGLILSGISLLWVGYLLHQYKVPEVIDMARIWMGLDTRCAGFFLGMSLATLGTQRIPSAQGSVILQVLLGIAVAMTLCVLGAVFWNVGIGENQLLIFAWPVVMISAALLLCFTCLIGGFHARWLFTTPLQWLGNRSLAIYVWYWPIIELIRLPANSPVALWVWEIVQAIGIGLMAELTHRFIVEPLLSGLSGNQVWWKSRRMLISVLSFLGALALLYLVPISTTAQLQSLMINISHLPISRHLNPEDWQVETKPLTNHQAMLREIESSQHLSHPAIVGETSWILIIGDGLVYNARDALSRLTPDSQVSADFNARSFDIQEEIGSLRRQGQLAPQIVLMIGNTHAVGFQDLDQLMDALSDRERVLLVNNSAYGRYAYQNNRIFNNIIHKHRHVALVDWLSVSTHHPEYFAAERLKLTPAGQSAITDLIRKVGGLSASAHVSQKPYTESLAVLIDKLPLMDAQRPMLGLLHPITSRSDLKQIDALGWYVNVNSSALKPRTEQDLDEGNLWAAPLIRNPKPIAPDAYWNRIADCETSSNWKHGGRYSGGLGIYDGTWLTYGGSEFSSKAQLATREQQIIVANRISTQGYYNPDGSYTEPVGFTGWGCANMAARPVLIVHTQASILAQPYRWLQQGSLVEELEAVLGLPISGVYDLSVRQAHLMALAKLNLPKERAPNPTHIGKTTALRKRRATLPTNPNLPTATNPPQ